jgi:hypothetical protein
MRQQERGKCGKCGEKREQRSRGDEEEFPNHQSPITFSPLPITLPETLV